MIMRHWYVVFPEGTSLPQAQALLSKWDAKLDKEQPGEIPGEGDLFLAVQGPDNLADRARKFKGVEVYDNEARPELYF